MKTGALIAIAVVASAVIFTGVGWYAGSVLNPQVSYQTRTVTTPSAQDIGYSFNNSSFDFSSIVDENGTVSTKTSIIQTLTIENTDDAVINDPKIVLYDPEDNDEGLDDDLEEDELIVKITANGADYPLFNDDDYVQLASSPVLADLTPDATISLSVNITLDTGSEVFQDGHTYDCCMYWWEPDYQDSQKIEFTITT